MEKRSSSNDVSIPLPDAPSDPENVSLLSKTTPKNESIAQQRLKIMGAVSLYISVSVTLVFLNKFLLSYSEDKFSFPLLLTWFQLILALLFVIIMGVLGRRFSSFSSVPMYSFQFSIGKQIFPLSVVYVSMLATNNLCLNYVEVSYFQVVRSLAVIFQIIFTYFILNTKTSFRAIQACLVVITGFWVGTIGELRFSWLGVFFGVLSSVFVAIHGILIKKSLAYVNQSEWTLLGYNATMAIPLMVPLMYISGELDQLMTFTPVSPHFLIFWIILTSVLGLLLNYAVFLQVKYTSPLTSVIVGASKSCVQAGLSILIFQNPVSIMGGTGIVITILGSLLYSFVRDSEMKQKLKRQN